MSSNSGPGFSNVGAPPTVQQPISASQQRARLNRRYLVSLTGILRLILIIFLFAAWISAAAVLKPGGILPLPDALMASRGAYLFFSIVGWLIAIFLFVINLFNLISVGFCGRLPWSLITLATNVLWIIPMFVVSIVAAVRETDARNLGDLYSSSINYGAFASAAFFGFLCTIIYVADSVYHLITIMRGGANATPPYAA